MSISRPWSFKKNNWTVAGWTAGVINVRKQSKEGQGDVFDCHVLMLNEVQTVEELEKSNIWYWQQKTSLVTNQLSKIAAD